MEAASKTAIKVGHKRTYAHAFPRKDKACEETEVTETTQGSTRTPGYVEKVTLKSDAQAKNIYVFPDPLTQKHAEIDAKPDLCKVINRSTEEPTANPDETKASTNFVPMQDSIAVDQHLSDEEEGDHTLDYPFQEEYERLVTEDLMSNCVNEVNEAARKVAENFKARFGCRNPNLSGDPYEYVEQLRRCQEESSRIVRSFGYCISKLSRKCEELECLPPTTRA